MLVGRINIIMCLKVATTFTFNLNIQLFFITLGLHKEGYK